MPRQCTICTHKKRAQIEKKLAASEPLRKIASQFETNTASLNRHKTNCIGGALVKMKTARKAAIKDVHAEAETKVFREAVDDEKRVGPVQSAVTVEGVVARIFEGVMKLWDACDRDLSDPDDPKVYSLRPRASEIRIEYEEFEKPKTKSDKGKWIRRTGTLQEVLDLAFVGGDRRLVRDAAITHNDRAKLLLDTADKLGKNAEFLAKLEGRFLPVEKEMGTGNTIQLAVVQNILIQCGLLKG
jgi:hypothetical protein